MINPDRVHRSRAVISRIGTVQSEVRLQSGHAITAWTSDLPEGAAVGDEVNVQAQFSITLDSYVCITVRRVRTNKKEVSHVRR
jgi:hypothetical protein